MKQREQRKLDENQPESTIPSPERKPANIEAIIIEIGKLRSTHMQQRKTLAVMHIQAQLLYPREDIATAIACMKERKMRFTVTPGDLPISRRGKLR